MEIVAHQPAAADAAGQLSALRRAGTSGADRVELDVLAVAGGLRVAHDRRAARRHPPTLAEAVAVLEQAPVALLLDIKGEEAARPLGEWLAASGWAPRTLLSGDLSAVTEASALAPGATRAWTLPAPRGDESHPPAHAGPLNAATGRAKARVRHAAGWAVAERLADAVCVDRRFVTAALCAAVHAAGGRVLAWTVDRPAQARRLAAQQVDGLISNRPAEIAQALLSS